METTELSSSPSLPSLYARAVSASLLPGGGEALPERELVLHGAELAPKHVADYARVCGFGVRDTVPGTFPHVIAFPLQMKLMTERDFPFSVLGLVHIANRIDVLAPIPAGSRLDLRMRAEDLRPHRRGRQFDLATEARLSGSVVWRGRSTYLHREKASPEEAPREPDEGIAFGERSLVETAVWRVPGDIGRRYAGVSGDRNPIHMHPLSARLFGFPSAIAHGMWTKARCLAAFEGRLPDAYSIAVAFKAPLRVPGTVRFLSGRRDQGDGWAFAVESADREHLHALGTIGPAPDQR
jgi:acyl dehydratase